MLLIPQKLMKKILIRTVDFASHRAHTHSNRAIRSFINIVLLVIKAIDSLLTYVDIYILNYENQD